MENHYSEDNRNEQSLIQMLMFRYWPYWPLFAVLAIVFLAGGYFYLKITPPKYRSTASVLIKDEKKGVDNSQMIESLNIYASKKIVENEIEVIKSKTLLMETVKQLNLCAPVYSKILLGKSGAYSKSPVVVEVKENTIIKEASELQLLIADESVYFNKESIPLNKWIETPYGTIRFVQNPHLAEIEDNQLFYFDLVDPRRVVEDLGKKLEISPVSKLSTVVTLSIVDEEPRKGEDILNTLINVYTKASIEEKNNLAANTMEFVEERIASVERQLDSVEAKIQQYKSSKGVVNLSEQGKLYLQNVGENDRKVSEINMQLAVLDKVEDYVIRKEGKGGLVPATLGINDPGLSQLVEKLYESEIKYERLSKTTPANNLIMVSLRNEIEQIRPGILENIRNQRQSLNAGLGTVKASSNQYASVLQSIPRKEKELLEINRQQLIKNNVYTFLLQKREETALSYASNVGDNRLIDRSTTGQMPENPKKSMVYIFSVALAMILGAGWVSMREVLGSKVLFRSEIEDRTKHPIIAEISYSGINDYIVVGKNKRKVAITEQFRQLRASAGLYGKANKKIVMITSSIAGEGKSFVSANFATSLAHSKKKILLIDMDMRSPRLSKYFNVDGKKGIAEVLLEEIEIMEVINATDHPNLFIIGAGIERSNPTETLINGNFQPFLDILKSSFDYIILDTPPVEPVSDAYLISPFCDKTIFVIRHAKTPKTVINRLDVSIDALTNPGLLFNGVRSRGFLNKSKEYGYGYKSPYTYGS